MKWCTWDSIILDGNIEKLRAEREKVEKQEVQTPSVCPPMPPAPMMLKWKRRLIDESEDVGSLEMSLIRSQRKVEAIAGRNEDVVVEVNQVKSKKVEYGKRTSPRFAKRRSP
ncbi:hypothetical protein K7X08_032690 [Anisodus acutangulus]|uniref:Uncharacterized protein n=1 Tax=Anisodus acutangulus TaxID=402998 RepID=A0A9Q1MYJ3_9SOLA|nr:hypothetical protein K7X08_032690 [Anisodus acutangulus]